MKTFGTILAVCCALVISVVGAADKKAVTKTKCVVAGKEINIADAKTASYKKGTVYVCCDNCKAKFEKDASKFAVKANHQLVQTGQYKQVKCPLAGRPVNPSKSVEVAGVKVGVCCAGCQGKLSKAAGDAQLKMAFSDKAFEKGFAPAK